MAIRKIIKKAIIRITITFKKPIMNFLNNSRSDNTFFFGAVFLLSTSISTPQYGHKKSVFLIGAPQLGHFILKMDLRLYKNLLIHRKA